MIIPIIIYTLMYCSLLYSKSDFEILNLFMFLAIWCALASIMILHFICLHHFMPIRSSVNQKSEEKYINFLFTMSSVYRMCWMYLNDTVACHCWPLAALLEICMQFSICMHCGNALLKARASGTTDLL